MINWRNGKATFVGASKYLIKGFFQYSHSITSVGPAPPDIPEANGVTVNGQFGDGVSTSGGFGSGCSVTSSFGTGVKVDGDL